MSQTTSPSPAMPTTTASVGTSQTRDGKPHYYRLGIVGSKNSGKTCLLAALSMARLPNPAGYTAVRPPLNDEKRRTEESFKEGDEWITLAIRKLGKGEWPEPTPYEECRRSLAFEFTDGATRQKYVELFDYSGELLNPAAADSDLAENLRETLREVDGLLVLAEHPASEQDSKRLEQDLNGLLRVFALLNDERRSQAAAAPKTVPIALLVNKWDRSPHFDPALTNDGHAAVLTDKFLKQSPSPFHQTVANMLRPAADECFKVFPVSAIRPTRREDGSEVPPTGGALHSTGLEDPFLWLIECVDDLALKRQEQQLHRFGKWWTTPFFPFLVWSVIKAVRTRFEPHTPEGRRAACLSKAVRLLCVRQLAICFGFWMTVVMAVECLMDGRSHRTALSQIESPVEHDGWENGVSWLRNYGESNACRHLLYRWYLSKPHALDKANEVESQKDRDAFELITRLKSESKLRDAGELARQQLPKFPNSPLAEQREAVIAEVARLQTEQELEKQLNKWSERLAGLSIKQSETEDRIEGILEEIRSLEAEIRGAANVPLQDAQRKQWSALLASVNPVRVKWEQRLGVVIARDKIMQAIDAQNFLDAADLLAVEPSAHPELLNKFQLSLRSWLSKEIDTLSEEGAECKAAVDKARKYLQPSRRPVITPDMVAAIEEIIKNTEQKGDMYFYNLALKERNDQSLEKYLSSAPLQSMVEEVSAYRKWLEDRKKPRNLTFRLMEIQWHPDQKAGLIENTRIEFFVNQKGDARNYDVVSDWREKPTEHSDGLRSVDLNGVPQTDAVELTFKTWTVRKFTGGTHGESKFTKKKSAEDWAKFTVEYDSAGNKLTIQVDGVIPEPLLPAWHLPQ